MEYYDDLQFVCYADIPESAAAVCRRNFDYYGLQYNHSGTLIFNGKRYTGSDCFCTHPGKTFTYGAAAGKSRHHTFICVTGARVQQMIKQKLWQLFPVPVQINDPRRMLQMMQQVIKYLTSPDFLHREKAVNAFEQLLIFLQEDRNMTNSLPQKNLAEFSSYIEKIRQAPEKEWDFAAIAGELDISESHFRFCFKQITGYAPNQFVIECRLNMAVYLLRLHQYSISEIAHRCGFSDSAYFSRLFKKHRGVPPQRYFKSGL